MQKRLGRAIIAFLALMLTAAWRLHGRVLMIVLIVLGALMAKSLIAVQAEKIREADQEPPSEPSPEP